MISAIVPVYNNEDTIEKVLRVLVANKDIDEVITIDDCSSDNSVRVIKNLSKELSPKLKFFANKKNLGKGGNVAKAIRVARGDTLFLCDADMSALSEKYVSDMIKTYKTGRFIMVIGNMFPRNHISAWQNIVSGQRIVEKKIIKPYLGLIAQMGNGIEQITNFACGNKKIKIIYSKSPGHILKYQRGDAPYAWVKEYLMEVNQLAKTELILRKHGLKNYLEKLWNSLR